MLEGGLLPIGPAERGTTIRGVRAPGEDAVGRVRGASLSGAVPLLAGEWLLPDARTTARGESHTPGWEDEGHYLDDPPQGRFLHTETMAKLAVCLAREWFLEADPGEALDPRQARFCWTTLTWVVQQAIQRDWPLYRLPGLTILNIWKLRAPASYAMDRLDLDIGREIQANEPQHRVEHYLAPGRCDCGDCPPLIGAGQLAEGSAGSVGAAGARQIGGFAYADGRFFFHGAPPKELGAAPATRLNGEDATRLFTTDPYWPARYRVDDVGHARVANHTSSEPFTARCDWAARPALPAGLP